MTQSLPLCSQVLHLPENSPSDCSQVDVHMKCLLIGAVFKAAEWRGYVVFMSELPLHVSSFHNSSLLHCLWACLKYLYWFFRDKLQLNLYRALHTSPDAPVPNVKCTVSSQSCSLPCSCSRCLWTTTRSTTSTVLRVMRTAFNKMQNAACKLPHSV